MPRERTFIYFLPGRTEKPSAQQLAEAGLDAVLADASLACTPISQGRGPGGGPGVLISPAGQRSPLYKPDRQQWQDFGKFHLGWWTDLVPRPEDLARDEPLPGHRVKLGDGNEWLVPCVNLLPVDLTWSPDGGWAGQRTADTHGLIEIQEQWLEEITRALRSEEERRDAESAEQGEIELTVAGAADQATRVLAVNYHVGPAELAGLHVLTSRTVGDVLNHLCDLPGIKKKTGSGGSSSGPG